MRNPTLDECKALGFDSVAQAEDHGKWLARQKVAKYVRGQKVTCNGNPQGVVQYRQDGSTMYVVRLWQGFRHVGDVVVSEYDLDLENGGVS